MESILTPAEATRIQSKLWDILTSRVESYTMGGSSSVRAELAQELLRSAGFVINYGLRRGLDHGVGYNVGPEDLRAHLLNDDFDALFKAGLEAIRLQVTAGEELLHRVESTAADIDNLAYRETVRELGVFFKRYHYHHFAHEIPCVLSYPLAHPADEALHGIDYINEYLRRLVIENDLVSRFDTGTVTRLLKAASPAYREDLMSIYETVTANALALTLLGGDVRALEVTERDRRQLFPLVGAWPEDIAATKLEAVSSGLCAILELSGDEARDYLAQTAAALYVRLKPALQTGRLEHVFPSLFVEKEARRAGDTYIDGALMDDEKLRALIDTLTSCREVSDKLALVRRHIFSLRDLSEVLGICFWGDEQEAMFDALSPEELEHLRRFAANRRAQFPDWRSETDWEEKLNEYRRK
jgi:hypothetical protein